MPDRVLRIVETVFEQVEQVALEVVLEVLHEIDPLLSHAKVVGLEHCVHDEIEVLSQNHVIDPKN